MSHSRLHREDPARTEPIRDWSTLYRQSNSWNSRDASANPKSGDEATRGGLCSDTVAQGVKLGYRVIEEYMRQGQRIAQQINNRSYGLGTMGNDIREISEQMLRYYSDLVSLWLDLMGSIAGNPDLIRNLFGLWQPQSEPSVNAAPANGATTVSIEVVSARPAQVTLDLRPQSEGLPLATHGLRALDPEKPPLTDITFEPGADNGPVSLRIRVPEGQPPGLYTGVVIDRDTGQPRGTLSVRIAG